MTLGSHDTLVYRLSEILIKLNQGEKLNPAALAEEFGVNLRTIQRDLNVRLAYLPLEKKGGYYSLDPAYLGKISYDDIRNFAGLAGIQGLFPSMSQEFFRDVFDSRIQSTLLVKGHNYENLAGKESLFRKLEEAISDCRHISMGYQKKDGEKSYDNLAPYKLMNHKGIWYLAALDGKKMKTFSFSKIKHVQVRDDVFLKDTEKEKELFQEDGIWFTEEKIEFVLKVSSDVAGYFKRRKLIANQVVEKELANGDLIISTKVGHHNQVLPIVRYWIPHIQIISPEDAKKELFQILKEYSEEN